ncbi:hypothetical protein KSP39_PZI010439 [Platanthera zijinensis]|uniref:Uncharacterized protein n=1 Tax=Platanthera zijinensis TaxID=2320716 RepID=A0AAP0G6D7_9ASPA
MEESLAEAWPAVYVSQLRPYRLTVGPSMVVKTISHPNSRSSAIATHETKSTPLATRSSPHLLADTGSSPPALANSSNCAITDMPLKKSLGLSPSMQCGPHLLPLLLNGLKGSASPMHGADGMSPRDHLWIEGKPVKFFACFYTHSSGGFPDWTPIVPQFSPNWEVWDPHHAALGQAQTQPKPNIA